MARRACNTQYIIRLWAGLLACLMGALLALPTAALSVLDISSEAAILMDASTGQVLFQKNMNEIMYPASITKIMTGLLVMESCDSCEMVTVTETAVDLPAGSSYIALTPGERLSVKDAMYALMLPSANDAANALAEHVSGSQSAFSDLMTRRAREIGARNTSFTNAHGLPDKNHMTTAYDMALITREALKNEAFMTYFGADRYVMPATNLAEARPFTNYQYMLVDDSYFYNGDVVGGKVGYTRLAGHTMSTVAKRNDRTLICVVMNTSRDQKFYDTKKLLDYGFDEFAPFTIGRANIHGGTLSINGDGFTVDHVDFAGEDIKLLLHQNIDPALLALSYDYPDYFSSHQDIVSHVSLSAPAIEISGLPVPLASLMLPSDITWFELSPASPVVGIQPPRIDELPAKFWDYALAGFIVTLMIGGVMAAAYLVVAESRHTRVSSWRRQ